MTTLRNQLEAKGITVIPNFFSRVAEQNCEVLESLNRNGCEFLLCDFGKRSITDYPGNIEGLTVVVLEEGELADVERNYVKAIFNK